MWNVSSPSLNPEHGDTAKCYSFLLWFELSRLAVPTKSQLGQLTETRLLSTFFSAWEQKFDDKHFIFPLSTLQHQDVVLEVSLMDGNVS